MIFDRDKWSCSMFGVNNVLSVLLCTAVTYMVYIRLWWMLDDKPLINWDVPNPEDISIDY